MSIPAFSRQCTLRSRPSRRVNILIVMSTILQFYFSVFGAALNHGQETKSLLISARQGVPSFLLPTSGRATGYSTDFCDGTTPTNFLRSTNRAWLAFLLPTTVFTLIGLSLVTENYFLSSLHRICHNFDISPDVAGATLWPQGKLFTSIMSVFMTVDDLGIGTIVGSAMFNILILIGLSAVLAKQTLRLDFRPLLRDIVFFVASVITLLVFILFSTPGRADWWEGLILLLGYALYILFMKYMNAPYLELTKNWVNQENIASPQVDADSRISESVRNSENAHSFDADTQDTEGVSEMLPGNLMVDKAVDKEVKEPSSFLGVDRPITALGWVTFPLFFPWKFLCRWTIVKCDTHETKKWWPLTFVTSIVWIVDISYAMVDLARLSGCFIGIPSSMLARTILAAGTNVANAFASVAVRTTGLGDMAVSTAIGTNIFAMFVGLGLPWFFGGLVKRKAQKITISPMRLVVTPIAILCVIAILFVSILVVLKWKLSKIVAYSLFLTYLLVLTYSIFETIFSAGTIAA